MTLAFPISRFRPSDDVLPGGAASPWATCLWAHCKIGILAVRRWTGSVVFKRGSFCLRRFEKKRFCTSAGVGFHGRIRRRWRWPRCMEVSALTAHSSYGEHAFRPTCGQRAQDLRSCQWVSGRGPKWTTRAGERGGHGGAQKRADLEEGKRVLLANLLGRPRDSHLPVDREEIRAANPSTIGAGARGTEDIPTG